MKKPLCVIHGRFQLLHNGHVEDLVLPAFNYAKHVVIGICNPEPDLTAYDEANPHRSESTSNPFSYWERLEMFKAFYMIKTFLLINMTSFLSLLIFRRK